MMKKSSALKTTYCVVTGPGCFGARLRWLARLPRT